MVLFNKFADTTQYASIVADYFQISYINYVFGACLEMYPKGIYNFQCKQESDCPGGIYEIQSQYTKN